MHTYVVGSSDHLLNNQNNRKGPCQMRIHVCSINVKVDENKNERKNVDDLLVNLPPDSPTAAMKFLSGNQMGQSRGSGF